MYGYSWLKPAGCAKTMLGRREEEIERDEVERQLHEVEAQERNAMEAEEQERLEMLRRQGEEGETVGTGERDLDDEVPDMDAPEDEEEEDDEDEEDMEGDLDDEVPDADAGESSWVYDTNRDPDTESEEGQEDDAHEQSGISDLGGRRQHIKHTRNASGAYLGMEDISETEAMVNAMLDEDELGEMEHEHDLDDGIPDMDMDVVMDAEDEEYDLDDDVPEADEEGEWQHTDTELEESEMDISILPNTRLSTSSKPTARQRSSNVGPGTTHEEMRRTSGNMMMPPPQYIPQTRQSARTGRLSAQRNITPQYQTPIIADTDSISNLISTDRSNSQSQYYLPPPHTTNIHSASTAEAEDSLDPQRRRNWLNPAGARRNLFSGFGRGNANIGTANISFDTGSSSTSMLGSQDQNQNQNQNQDQNQNQNQNLDVRISTVTGASASSGGLFTPPVSRVPTYSYNNDNDNDDNMNDVDIEPEPEPPRSRTRSGRILGGFQVGRRNRRRDGEI